MPAGLEQDVLFADGTWDLVIVRSQPGPLVTSSPESLAHLAHLPAFHAGWQIWVVPRVGGGALWCARLWDGGGWVLKAHSLDELAECRENEAGGLVRCLRKGIPGPA